MGSDLERTRIVNIQPQSEGVIRPDGVAKSDMPVKQPHDPAQSVRDEKAAGGDNEWPDNEPRPDTFTFVPAARPESPQAEEGEQRPVMSDLELSQKFSQAGDLFSLCEALVALGGVHDSSGKWKSAQKIIEKIIIAVSTDDEWASITNRGGD